MRDLRSDAQHIIMGSIEAVLPETAVKEALHGFKHQGDVYLVAIGKAGWRMAQAAVEMVGESLKRGIVITKYDHSMGPIAGCQVYEAGHPVPDRNSLQATRQALQMTQNLGADDLVLFLVSGGGSALFEALLPGVTLDEMMNLTRQLLRCGANIVEINTIRKHLSAVKGGRFAQWVAPARIQALVLSDVLGDRLDAIASGPAYPDSSTSEDARQIISKYGLSISPGMQQALAIETPKSLDTVRSQIIGSVTKLTNTAAEIAQAQGYRAEILTTTLECEAVEAGLLLAQKAHGIRRGTANLQPPCAVILGGETVVNIIGEGKGGRCQELALAAAAGINGLEGVVIAASGSDGTDGPTDAAGGIVDGYTAKVLAEKHINIEDVLQNNDSYHALQQADSLLITGPTGTNVNDLYLLLVDSAPASR
jgi:hydroxypyruvate reductase